MRLFVFAAPILIALLRAGREIEEQRVGQAFGRQVVSIRKVPFRIGPRIDHENHKMSDSYTEKQGQYLAYIYHYTKIHRRPPAEAEIQAFFRVSPPAVHQMILKLEGKGLIRRTPGVARSIEVLLPVEALPHLA